MEHLSQEELLLLADGELADGREAHLDACATCRSAAGALQGRLTAIDAELRAAAPLEGPESPSASWVRLRNAISGQAPPVVAAHLDRRELVLALDEELPPERALHLEACEACHDDLLRVQALLFDIEHELRALIPAESRDRKLAAAARLEQALYPPKKVISFPLRWGAVYAAAAALTFAVFGGLWTSQQEIQTPAEPALIAGQEPAPAAAAPQAVAAISAPEHAQPVVLAATSGSEPVQALEAATPAPLERFELPPAEQPASPRRPPLSLDAQTAWRPAPATSELALALRMPTLAPPAPAEAAAPAPPEPSDSANAAVLLAGFEAATRSGAWLSGISPEVRGGQLTFIGRVGSISRRDEIIAGISRELKDQDASFDIAVAASSMAAAATYASFNLGDRPAGGMMRTALLAHYGDAARRSFQQPTLNALESEIARFAGNVYLSQSKLVRHAYALKGLLQDFDAEALSSEQRRQLRDLVRFHASGVAEGETRIYDALSEALPRRYWNHRGDREPLNDEAAAASAHALLADALLLDETLTTLLGSASASIQASETETSAGALLYRIRTRARNLTSGMESVR